MKFNKIKFHNYRCFINGEITFMEQDDRNINLIIGTNGAGKTEVLFAFWWTLYGFDFKTLKNKEATPYALNSTIYKALEAGSQQNADCKVTIELDCEGTIYVIERKAEYRKTPQNVRVEEYQSICYYKPNHELSLPIRDEAEINKILTRIIPKAILYGIVFDGERMKQLSSEEENSVKAIGGVINDITNVELIELCSLTYQQIQKAINKRAKDLAKQYGQNTLGEIIAQIDLMEAELADAKLFREKVDTDLAVARTRSDELSRVLSGIHEAQLLELQRSEARDQVEREQKRKSELLKSFMDSLKRGHLLACEPLFQVIRELLTKYDVPVGLTVEAVNNILKRSKCICGNEWTSEMRHELQELSSTLPPDNINSTIGEMVRQMSISVADVQTGILKDHKLLKDCNDNIQKLKETIASLSMQILNSGSAEAEEIEQENVATQKQIGVLEADLTILIDKIPSIEKELEDKKKIRASLSQHRSESVRIEQESRFVDKCIKALEKIKSVNRMTALRRINGRLIRAYESLCDDANYGRQIYIVQFNSRERYKLISYYKEKLIESLDIMRNNGEYASLAANGLSDEEINEIAILRCAQPNSTGQSKMNTLAFVKAILEYSNDMRSPDSFEVTKQYPLLIDAPFGDIFDENLEKSAQSLSSFTHQIILMVAKDSYETIAHHIGPHVNTVHIFEKQENEAFSEILVSSLGEI